MDAGREFVLAGGGESLRTLVVGAEIYEDEPDGEDLDFDFFKHCPNVTSLMIDNRCCLWKNAELGLLAKLEAKARIPLGFPVYSTILRELTCNSFSRNSRYADIWRRLGCRLEKMTVYDEFPASNEVDKIKEHCPCNSGG